VKLLIASLVLVLFLSLGALELFAARGVTDARVPGSATTVDTFSAAYTYPPAW
jgi:hypothetical protein